MPTIDSDSPITDLTTLECRAARRLTRLFRIERNGDFTRWPIETWRQLLHRRSAVIDEVLHLEKKRRTHATLIPAELGDALAELSREVARSRALAETRVALLAEELSRRHGQSPATGIRANLAGQLLGRG
jgi:hypothetical protein